MARRSAHIPKTALTTKKRTSLKASDFAVPSERKYPINDLFHARLALTYVLSPSNAAYRDEVVSAVLARYPELRFWWASRSRGLEAKRVRKATSRRASGRRMVANPYEEWMDEDELERERQRREDETLLRSLGPNVGLNADWMDSAYYIAPKGGRPNRTSGAIYLNDYDGDYWSLVQRFYDEAEEGDDRWETLKTFTSLKEALAYIEKHRDDLERQALGQKSNPRRKLPKNGEGRGIVSRAERGLGTKYRTMREGMLLEGGDVMLLPHRFPGHEGKRMTDLSEAGREWDYEYNDAKPILDVLAAAKAPMLRTSTLVKKLKEEGMSVDETFRGIDFLVSSRLLTRPRDGYVALAKKNPRPAAKRGKGKRSGGRTVAQSNAAKAMKLFHSGQASSLAEAWAMLRRR